MDDFIKYYLAKGIEKVSRAGKISLSPPEAYESFAVSLTCYCVCRHLFHLIRHNLIKLHHIFGIKDLDRVDVNGSCVWR